MRKEGEFVNYRRTLALFLLRQNAGLLQCFHQFVFLFQFQACGLPRCSSEWGRQLATGNPPLPFHRILPLLSISLSLVSAFFKYLASAVDDDGAEKIELTERLKDFLICRQRVNFA